MTRRLPLLTLALLPFLAVAACGSDGGSGSSGSTGKAQDIRSSLAKAYWKVDSALPDSVDVSVGKGKFKKCSSGKPDLAAYRVENLIDAKDDKMTMDQLLSQLKIALEPQGWHITLDSAQPSPAQRGDSLSKTIGYVANKDGMQLQLLLQERTDTVQAGGFLDLWSGCADLGKDQQSVLDKYLDGTVSDVYEPTAATPHPVPTGFPTP